MQLKMWYRSFKKKYLTFSEIHFCLCVFFFLSGFYFKDTESSQDSRGKEGTIFLFHSTTSTRSRTIRHLFATLDFRWLSHILYHTTCIYQAATRRDLPPYRIPFFASHLVLVKFQWETYNPSKSYLQAWDAYTASFK